MSRAWPYLPGVPAAGHVTSGGFWHPGRIDSPTEEGEPMTMTDFDTDHERYVSRLEAEHADGEHSADSPVPNCPKCWGPTPPSEWEIAYERSIADPDTGYTRCRNCEERIVPKPGGRLGLDWIHPHSADAYCGSGDGSTATPPTGFGLTDRGAAVQRTVVHALAGGGALDPADLDLVAGVVIDGLRGILPGDCYDEGTVA